MKNLLLVFFLIPCFALADEIDVKEMSNLELFGEIASYLSDVKNKQDDLAKTKKYKKSFEELDLRAKSGNPSAKIYRGFMDLTICQQAKKVGLDTLNNPSCLSAFSAFNFAANTKKVIFANERAYAFNYLGQMYSDGLGVEQSKLMASNSFYEAAVNYYKFEDKDNTLINLEKAINAYPDHQKAKQMLNSILNKKSP